MSLETMNARLNFRGGKYTQNRMIFDKRRSMLSAIKNSYQAARFSLYPSKNEFLGLFNPITKNMDFDTKMISTDFKNKVTTGSILVWRNTGTYWIVYSRDLTELGYFRGETRLMNWKTEWVDENREKHECLLSVVGPSATALRSSTTMQAQAAEDFPNANLIMLVQDTPLNASFFGRYQRFILRETTYVIDNIDNLSMPGVIQIAAYEYYSNLIEDNVEKGIRNYWNVLPVQKEEDKHLTSWAIEGPDRIQARFEVEFSTFIDGGYWVIPENETQSENGLPVKFVETDVYQKVIHVIWTKPTSGNFTIEYRTPNQKYQKFIVVDSLM